MDLNFIIFEKNSEGNLSRHLSAGAPNYLSTFQYGNYALASILREVDLLEYDWKWCTP